MATIRWLFNFNHKLLQQPYNTISKIHEKWEGLWIEYSSEYFAQALGMALL